MAAAVPRAELCLAENRAPARRRLFMVGEVISIADLLVVPHLAYLSVTPGARPATPTCKTGARAWSYGRA